MPSRGECKHHRCHAQRPRVFTQRLATKRRTTTTSSRRERCPQASSSPAQKRGAFARHPTLSHRSPRAKGVRPDPRSRSGHHPVEDVSEPPTSTPLIARTTKKGATTADMAPAGEPPMRTTILGRRSGIQVQYLAHRPPQSTSHGRKSESPHLSLLTRHEPRRLGLRHHCKGPIPVSPANPDGSGETTLHDSRRPSPSRLRQRHVRGP